MASTYTPIATTTLGSTATSITFNSFSGYTDLKLVFNGKTTGVALVTFQVNGDTNTNYSYTNLGARALSSTPFSARDTNKTAGSINWYTAQGTQGGMCILDFLNYSNSTTYKTILSSARVNEGNATYSGVEDTVNLWRSTSAITSLTVICGNSYSFDVGSTFTLYGITAA